MANMADEGPYGVPLSRAMAKDSFFKASKAPTENKAVTAAIKAQNAYYEKYPKQRDIGAALHWSVEEITDL